MKTIDEALKEGNSNINQEIKGKFVGREIHANVNQMVEFILRQEDSEAPFNMEDVENFFSFPEFIGKHANFEGGTESERNQEVERLRLLIEEAEENGNDQLMVEIEEERTELLDLESEASEVYEWWLVSDFLVDKLSALGHPVINLHSHKIWGRCTTGQAILLDYAITKICAEMEILEGQTNSWV